MTLYLLALERDAYDQLPAELKKAWGGLVQDETGDTWETEEQLQVRMKIALKELSPKDGVALAKMIEKTKTVGIDGISEKDFPKNILPQMFFILGATGLTGIIYTLLRKAESVNDLEFATMLSFLRHQTLMTNAIPLKA